MHVFTLYTLLVNIKTMILNILWTTKLYPEYCCSFNHFSFSIFHIRKVFFNKVLFKLNYWMDKYDILIFLQLSIILLNVLFMKMLLKNLNNIQESNYFYL